MTALSQISRLILPEVKVLVNGWLRRIDHSKTTTKKRRFTNKSYKIEALMPSNQMSIKSKKELKFFDCYVGFTLYLQDDYKMFDQVVITPVHKSLYRGFFISLRSMNENNVMTEVYYGLFFVKPQFLLNN
ncbi:MAG TPA: hypothetical protein VGE63_01030 [Candidatus Paceibacterota bacterium]